MEVPRVFLGRTFLMFIDPDASHCLVWASCSKIFFDGPFMALFLGGVYVGQVCSVMGGLGGFVETDLLGLATKAR